MRVRGNMAFANSFRGHAGDPQQKNKMNHSISTNNNALTVGKYQISPLTKAVDNGWYACSVSIRSGSGSATTDRVVRLTRLFRDRLAAAEYALAEGLQWIGVSRPVAACAA
jgi:hypothetical protein